MDLWHPARILLEKYGYRVVYDAQSRVDAKLSFVIYNGDRLWRPTRSEALVEIQSRLSEIRLGLIWTGYGGLFGLLQEKVFLTIQILGGS